MNYNQLYHHGVLGQKWGVRRYQNYDGTLKHPKSSKAYSGKIQNVDGSLTAKGREKYAKSSKRVVNNPYTLKNKAKDVASSIAIPTAVGAIAGLTGVGPVAAMAGVTVSAIANATRIGVKRVQYEHAREIVDRYNSAKLNDINGEANVGKRVLHQLSQTKDNVENNRRGENEMQKKIAKIDNKYLKNDDDRRASKKMTKVIRKSFPDISKQEAESYSKKHLKDVKSIDKKDVKTHNMSLDDIDKDDILKIIEMKEKYGV